MEDSILYSFKLFLYMIGVKKMNVHSFTSEGNLMTRLYLDFS